MERRKRNTRLLKKIKMKKIYEYITYHEVYKYQAWCFYNKTPQSEFSESSRMNPQFRHIKLYDAHSTEMNQLNRHCGDAKKIIDNWEKLLHEQSE